MWRGPLLVAALGLGAAGANGGCSDDADTTDAGGGAGCSFCEPDDDPCTEERCDPGLGRCVSVPRDAANACRFDWHCDDGVDCTLDRCAADACGLMRCRRELAPGCDACGDESQCEDADPCSQESCIGEACTSEPIEGCEPRCAPGPAEQSPDDGLWLGVVEAAGACETCGCATGVALRAAEGLLAIETGGAARCERICAGATNELVCRPLAAGVRYVVWGERTGTTIATEGWCLASEFGLTAGRYTARITWSEGAQTTFVLQAGPGEAFTMEPGACTGACVVDVPSQTGVVGGLEGWGRVLPLLVVGSGAAVTMPVRLVPDARGYQGTAHVLELSATVRLDRE